MDYLRVISHTLRDMYGADQPTTLNTNQWIETLEVATRFMLDQLSIYAQNVLALQVDDYSVCGLYHAAEMFQYAPKYKTALQININVNCGV